MTLLAFTTLAYNYTSQGLFNQTFEQHLMKIVGNVVRMLMQGYMFMAGVLLLPAMHASPLWCLGQTSFLGGGWFAVSSISQIKTLPCTKN